MNKAKLAVIGIVVLAALWVGVYALTSTMPTATDQAATDLPKSATDTPAPSNQTNPSGTKVPKLIIGNPDAKLTIIEYGDFQCPICKNFFDKTEPQITKDYIDTGKANIEFRVEVHIGAESILAGEAAYCANDQNKFKEMHHALYSRQKGINAGTFSAANLKKIASELGIAREKFDDCLDQHVYRQTVLDSHAEAHTKISGTPTFFIGSQKIVGAQPYSIFKPIIESQLK